MEAIPLAGALFGAGSKSQTKSTPTDMSASEYAALRPLFAQLLTSGALAGHAGQNVLSRPITPAPTAPMTPQETAAMNFTNELTMDPIRAALLRSTMQGNFLPGQAGANPFLKDAIGTAQQSTAEALKYAMERQVPGMFAAAGHQGSSRLGTGSTARDLQLIRAGEIGGRALGDIATKMSSDAYEAERARQMGAAQLQQSDIQAARDNFIAQQLPRLIKQSGFDTAISVGMQSQQAFNQLMTLIGGVTAPVVANSAVGTSTGAMPGLFSQLFPKGIYNPAPSTFGVTSPPSPQGVA